MGKETDETLESQVRSYTNEVMAQGYRVHSVVVFGSRVRGNHLKTSDIDLLLVADNLEENFVERLVRLSSLWRHRTPLEVFPYTSKEVINMFLRGSITLYDALDQGTITYDDGFITPLQHAFRKALAEEILGKSPRGWWKLPDQSLLRPLLKEVNKF